MKKKSYKDIRDIWIKKSLASGLIRYNRDADCHHLDVNEFVEGYRQAEIDIIEDRRNTIPSNKGEWGNNKKLSDL